MHRYVDGLVQDCSTSIANALDILQSFTKPSMYTYRFQYPSDFHEDQHKINMRMHHIYETHIYVKLLNNNVP